MTYPIPETCWRLELLLEALGDAEASGQVGGGGPLVPMVWKQQIQAAVQSTRARRSTGAEEPALGRKEHLVQPVLKEGHRARAKFWTVLLIFMLR